MRYLSGRTVSLAHTFLDDETAIIPSSVSVNVFPFGSDEAAFTGDATQTPEANDFTVEIEPLDVGLYEVEWVGAEPTITDIDVIEVVGGFLFSIPEARASDSELTDPLEYPAEEIKGYREIIETEFETITGRSFTPRVRSVTFTATGSDVAWLGLFDCSALLALSGPDGALEVSEYPLDANGLLSGLEALYEGDSVTATVAYGHTFPPADVRRAAFVRLRYLLAAESSGIPDRATSFVAAEGGTFTLSTPGRRGAKTGIPDVDAVLADYSTGLISDVMGAA